MRIHTILGVVFILASNGAWGEEKIYVGDQTFDTGATNVAIPVLLNTAHADGWFGFSVALKYDQTKIAIKAVEVAGTVSAVAATEGWQNGKIPNPADGRVSWGVVMDLGTPDGILDKKIPAGDNQTILILRADILATEATTCTIEPRNDLATGTEAPGAWVNLLSYKGEAPTKPTLAAGTITINKPVVGTFFKRGDPNDDDSLNLTDAVVILGYLFLGNPTTLGCEGAADVNDDLSVNLTDAVVLLGYLFLGNPQTLQLPGEVCGVDPTPDPSITCATYNSCK